MKKIFIVGILITFCTIFSASLSRAFSSFTSSGRKQNEQAKINNFVIRFLYEKQKNLDAQAKIADLDNQLQYEKQLNESLKSKVSDLEKQFQSELQINEKAKKDSELYQQNIKNAEKSRDLWMSISALFGLVCIALGIALWLRIRKAANILHNANRNDIDGEDKCLISFVE